MLLCGLLRLLNAQQTRMSVISNNLANVNTNGFKRDRAVFEDLLYQNIRQAGGQTERTPTRRLPICWAPVLIVATEKMQGQGNMVATENALDLAVEGRCLFQILQPDGTIAYTRDGSFRFLRMANWLTVRVICCSHKL